MLGYVNTNWHVEDTWGWMDRIPKRSFWARFHSWAWEQGNLKDGEFAQLYSDIGRPSVSPAQLTAAILIQLEKELSDRELEEATLYDDRVKYALGMSRNGPGLDAVTLCRFRQRLMAADGAKMLLDKVVAVGKERGLISGETVAIVDTFLVEGSAARQDTITLIRRAVAMVLKVAGFHECREELEQLLERKDYGSPKKPAIDWSNPDEKQALVESLVKDARKLVKAVRERGDAPEELKNAAGFLERVAEQDIEEDGEGRIRIRRGVAKDRVISTVDPEMRHGHKTSSNKTDGYKAHVIGDKKGEWVTGIEEAPANAPDAEKAEELVGQHKARVGQVPPKLLGDCAFGNPELRERLQAKGVEVVAPVPPAPRRDGHFSKDDFEINVEEGYVRCPAGQETRTLAWGKDERGRKIPVYRFPAEVCASCPLRAKCTSSKLGRQVRVHPREEVLQALKKEQKTPEFREEYRQRANIERINCDLKRHGARKARYIGRIKVKFQLMMAAVLHDIKLLLAAFDKQPGELPVQGVVSA
ncbi:MAG: IS1182 family transposase [Bacillota bacterium]|nr:IS1182 family transposase [Bacillota bacterium]